MSITTALKARRDALRDREAGFTLIELLVVVLIIGILAAIAIPVYLGVQNNAKDSGVKSDLVNDKTAVIGYQTANSGTLPTTTNFTQAVLGTYGYAKGANTTTLTYTTATVNNNAEFCIYGVSSTTNKFYVSTNSQGVVSLASTATGCPASTSW